MKKIITLLVATCNFIFCNLQSNAQSITAGVYHSLKVCNDGSIQATGHNFYGQLGNGDTTTSNVPVQVSSLTGITVVASRY